ncbi:MAG: tetratricopeptide repeat protein [Verrucomicrobiaceae bacterium]
MVLFSLLSLWLYFLSLSAGSRLSLWLLRSGAVMALLLAMQTKEISITVPALAVLLDWLVFGTRLRQAAMRAAPLLICLPLIPALVFYTAAVQHGEFGLNTALNIVNSREVPVSHWHYVVTELTVLVHYLRQLIWPTGLNIDPEWPMYRAFWNWQVLGAFSILVGVIVCAVWVFRRFRHDMRLALGFVGVLWFFLTVSISSGLVPLPDLVAEHRTYMPSVGVFLLAACLLDWLRCSKLSLRPGVVAPAVALVCTAALSWATYARNEVWSSRERLWEDTVAKSPNKFRTWGNLGAAYSDGGKEEQAVQCYRKALELEPHFQNGMLNLSNSLLRLNRPQESLDTTLDLIRLDENAGRRAPVVFTLGLGLAGVGRYDDAVSVFRELLAATPDDPMVHKALGLVYFQTGLPHRALDHYHQADKLQPGDIQLKHMILAAEQKLADRLARR